MSFLTDLVKNALGSDAPSAQSQTQGLVKGLMDLIQDERVGGIQGLVAKFQQSGLGDAVSSWVGKGENQSVSPQQIIQALGADQVAALSKEAGLPPEQGASALSSLLPSVIDKLTPEGLIPEKKTLLTLGAAILGGVGVTLAAKAAASAFRREEPESQSVPASAGEVPQPAPQVSAGGASAGATYTVSAGDTLSRIAKQFYGNANDWSRIFEANRDQLDNPDRIFPGQILRIP
jgi:uncharacterized protein YidB (DUF937 family)